MGCPPLDEVIYQQKDRGPLVRTLPYGTQAGRQICHGLLPRLNWYTSASHCLEQSAQAPGSEICGHDALLPVAWKTLSCIARAGWLLERQCIKL